MLPLGQQVGLLVAARHRGGRGQAAGHRCPRAYLEQATRPNADILAHEPADAWKYGLGFWVNDYGRLWPELPRDLFGAWGAGARYVWVSPALDLVVTLCPGPWPGMRAEADRIPREQAVLARLLDAVER